MSGIPLSQDQRDVIDLVDAVVAKYGEAPGDDAPDKIGEARHALADAGLWTLGAGEERGGGGAPLVLRLTALAALGRYWPALAWSSAQAHAAAEVLDGRVLESVHAARDLVCVVDADSPRSELNQDEARLRGRLSRLDPAGRSPHVLVLGGDTAWLIEPGSLGYGDVLRRTGLAGAMTISATVDAPVNGFPMTPGVRARLQLAGGAIAAGIAAEAAERALAYSRERVQFGAPLTALPTVRQSLFEQSATAAEAFTEALAAPETPHRAAAVLARNCERAISVAAAALQSHGGYGYLAEYGVERLLRDAVSLRAATDATHSARAAAAGADTEVLLAHR
ncbi:acyl-CoA dehydrogenase [Amycolatopsis acidicola]|uniref:Acyl-CoA dehydrogenase n=1 Tax=Amycolatopsis acidicola TaxID=2596893 RepID=A0A5N0VAA3_9PSEU|nr:acyl-CoA dehydrogenase family protein [Amycolatopsis acidicola]KAA9163296.1 acyl-CoA dehydrogenase [Amycolatopsis acidicola]